jgi:hypothetical protein
LLVGEPFSPEGKFQNLTIEALEVLNLSDVAWTAYERDGDEQSWAAKHALFFRSIFISSLGSALTRVQSGDNEALRTFMPHEGADLNGSVMVSPLRDKPGNVGLDAWFSEVERTANLNPRSSEHRFELNGKAALRVRYLNSAAGGTEMEAVYVVAGSRTFSIVFSGNNRGTPLETLGNYPVFMRMVQSFEVQVR